MSGLAAFQPAAVAQWYGEWKDGEMQIEAIGKDPTGNPIGFFSIESNRFFPGKAELVWILGSSLTATRAAR
jgi:hypothetical protein